MVEAEYAKALFELASTDKEEIKEELEIFIDALDENKEIYQIFDAPSINNKDKKDIITKVTKGFNDTLVRFLYVLVDNGRLINIKDITEEYKLLLNDSMKAVDVNVTSKNALDDIQLNKLNDLLSTKLGRKVNIINIVDDNLIGGIKCEYDGKLIDLSVRGKLNQIKNLL